MTTQRNLFEPAVDGRGIWHIYQMKAILATDEVKIKSFFEEMVWLSNYYPCKRCRNHLKKFIKENPFDIYYHVSNNGKNVGAFKYIWACHNSVNQRIGKPLMDFDTAYNLFDPVNLELQPCGSGCEEDEEEGKTDEKKDEKKLMKAESKLVKTTSNAPIRFIPTMKK